MTNNILDKVTKNKLNGFKPFNNSSVGNEITSTVTNFMLIQTLQNRILYRCKPEHPKLCYDQIADVFW